jgi:hypothetical protein
MLRRRFTPFLVVAIALVLAGIAAAAPTDPQVVLDPIDESWSKSIVLTPADLGNGWRETTQQESGSGGDDSSTFCPEANPDQSDLTATGGAASDFARGASSVSSIAIVWRTPEQAQANFDRTIAVMPALMNCTAQLFSGSIAGIKITVTVNRALQFPALAPRISAYRIRIVIKSTGRTKKRKPTVVNYDTIILGNGRASAWLFVTSDSSRPVSPAKERSLATALAARMERTRPKRDPWASSCARSRPRRPRASDPRCPPSSWLRSRTLAASRGDRLFAGRQSTGCPFPAKHDAGVDSSDDERLGQERNMVCALTSSAH